MTPEQHRHLSSHLKTLERQAAEVAQQHADDADFWPAFASLAEPIEEYAGRAGDAAHEFASTWIDEILIRLGKMDPAHRQT